MSQSQQAQILCGECKVPMQGPEDGDDDAIFSCPKCGESDTKAVVLAEAQAYVTDMAARSLQAQAKDISSKSPWISFSGDAIPDRKYRFITDITL